MRSLTVTRFLLFGLLLPGCDSAGEEPPQLRGRYDGTFTYIAPPGPFSEGGPVSEAWVLRLEENEGLISGAGDLGDDVHVTVSGAHDHPDVTLDFTDDHDAFAGCLNGTFSDDGRVLDGAYTSHFFFLNAPVTLTLASRSLL